MISFAQLLALSEAEFEIPCDVAGCRLYEAHGYRWLSSSLQAIQTAMSIEDPQALVLPNHRAMMLASLLPDQVSSVLDLGCGGGGFIRHIKGWQAAPRLSGVEMSGDMLHAAREHFALPPEQLIHVGDAVDFLGRDRARYDLVLCDLFTDRISPLALKDALFFSTLARRLNAGGAVAVNTLPDSGDALRLIVEAARQHFAGVGLLQLPELGNVLLFLQHEGLPEHAVIHGRLMRSRYAKDADIAKALESLRVL